jgi:hypothetical protein
MAFVYRSDKPREKEKLSDVLGPGYYNTEKAYHKK